MLSLKASWSGQTFALAKCSDSLEKKTRRRLTKEKRRTMVEFFIKKYQDSNNGNFPSLNLTHKEVGGSFYTVREIVRELIQENKVLGPGNPTSKALSLEDCLEEYPVGPLSMHPHQYAQEQKECSLLSNEHRVSSKESYEHVVSEPLNLLAFHPNGCLDSPSTHAKISDHVNQNLSSTAYTGDEEEDLGTPSGQTHDHSGANAYIYSEHQVRSLTCNNQNIEQPVLLGKSLSTNYTSSELGVNEHGTGMNRNSIAGTTDFCAESNHFSEIMGQDVLPETMILSNSGNDDTSSPFQENPASATRDVPPLASAAAETCDSDRSSLEEKGFSLETTEMHSFPHEMEAAMQADKDLAIKRSESIKNLPSSLINGAATTRPSSPISPRSETTKVETHSALKHSNAEGINTNIESYFCESPCPDAKGTPDDPLKAEYKDIASKSESKSILSSTSGKADKEQVREEINPVWAAVQAFVAAVIKFWTE